MRNHRGPVNYVNQRCHGANASSLADHAPGFAISSKHRRPAEWRLMQSVCRNSRSTRKDDDGTPPCAKSRDHQLRVAQLHGRCPAAAEKTPADKQGTHQNRTRNPLETRHLRRLSGPVKRTKPARSLCRTLHRTAPSHHFSPTSSEG